MAQQSRRATVSPDALSKVMADVSADNPEIRSEMEEIVKIMLKDVKRTFMIGSTPDKAVYARVVLPQLLKHMTNQESSRNSEQEDAIKRMMTSLGGDVFDD